MTEELLAEKARDAAPGRPVGEHLAPDVLARLRGDDEREEDAAAFRHLASCAACRARMAEPAAEVARVLPSAEVVPLRRKRALSRSLFALAAAAAMVIGVSSALKLQSRTLDVHVRSYAGTMGSSTATAVDPADRNVELSFESSEPAAALIVLDAAGRTLAPARAFAREGKVFRVVVAPRTFGKHDGQAIGWVIAGSREAIDQALALPAPNETSLRALGGRLARIEL